MISYPEGLYFHREHIWLKCEKHEFGNRYRIGVDKIFLHDAGIIESLDLPAEGDEISQDEVCGVIRGQNIKKLFFAPLTGEIVEVNFELHEDPDIIREDPYGIGWILLIDPADFEEEVENLLFGKEGQVWWQSELKKRQI